MRELDERRQDRDHHDDHGERRGLSDPTAFDEVEESDRRHAGLCREQDDQGGDGLPLAGDPIILAGDPIIAALAPLRLEPQHPGDVQIALHWSARGSPSKITGEHDFAPQGLWRRE